MVAGQAKSRSRSPFFRGPRHAAEGHPACRVWVVGVGEGVRWYTTRQPHKMLRVSRIGESRAQQASLCVVVMLQGLSHPL